MEEASTLFESTDVEADTREAFVIKMTTGTVLLHIGKALLKLEMDESA